MNLIRDYLKLIEGHRVRVAVILIIGVISGILEGTAFLTVIPIFISSIASPDVVPASFSSLMESIGVSHENFIRGLLAFFAFLGISGILSRLAYDTLLLKLRFAIEDDLRKKMTDASLNVYWPEFLSLKSGDMFVGIFTETACIANGLSSLLLGGIAVVVLSVYVATALYVSLWMSMLTLVFGVIIGLLSRRLSRRSFRQSHEVVKVSTSVSNNVGELLSQLKIIRLFGVLDRFRRRTFHDYAELIRSQYKLHQYSSISRLSSDLGAVLFVTFMLILFTHAGAGGVVRAMIFLALFYRLAPRMIVINDTYQTVRINYAYLVSYQKRCEHLISIGEPPSGTREPRFESSIVLDQVSFHYPSAPKESVLNNVSLEIRRNECVAIAGESGGGKSTTANLLTGLLRPKGGRLLVDGVPLNELDVSAWRSHIGFVMQTPTILHESVAYNIAFGFDAPNHQRLVESSKTAHALEFIEKLPQGFETGLGLDGGKLSGGQQQRIALARAIYRKPWLLILDEATSALDAVSEEKIHEALVEMKGRVTILIISHRMKTISLADRIYVFNNGKVEESGSWDALMKKENGTLRRMAELQMNK